MVNYGIKKSKQIVDNADSNRLLSIAMGDIWNPERFTEAREALGISVKEAADVFGITRQYLNMIEKGDREAKSEWVGKMSELYKQPVTFFLKDEHQVAKV